MADPTNAVLLAALSSITDLIRLREEQRFALETGTALGGPNKDGRYPLMGMDGVVRLFACDERRFADARVKKVVARNGPGPFTMALADVESYQLIGNGSATPNISVRLPNLPAGTCIMFKQTGSGRLIFSAIDSGTLVHSQNFTRTARANAVAVLIVDRVTNGLSTWTLGGDVGA